MTTPPRLATMAGMHRHPRLARMIRMTKLTSMGVVLGRLHLLECAIPDGPLVSLAGHGLVLVLVVAAVSRILGIDIFAFPQPGPSVCWGPYGRRGH